MYLSQIESNFENFIHPTCGYQICLLCTLAYYGDGKLDQKEMDFLLATTDSYTKKNIKDRKLFIKEFVLMVLDSLKKSLEEVESTENKIDSAKSITELFSSNIYDFFESKDNNQKDDDKKIRNKFYSLCEKIINLNGQKGKNEKALLSKVKKGFFKKTPVWRKCLAFYVLALIVFKIYKAYSGQ